MIPRDCLSCSVVCRCGFMRVSMHSQHDAIRPPQGKSRRESKHLPETSHLLLERVGYRISPSPASTLLWRVFHIPCNRCHFRRLIPASFFRCSMFPFRGEFIPIGECIFGPQNQFSNNSVVCDRGDCNPTPASRSFIGTPVYIWEGFRTQRHRSTLSVNPLPPWRLKNANLHKHKLVLTLTNGRDPWIYNCTCPLVCCDYVGREQKRTGTRCRRCPLVLSTPTVLY